MVGVRVFEGVDPGDRVGPFGAAGLSGVFGEVVVDCFAGELGLAHPRSISGGFEPVMEFAGKPDPDPARFGG